MKLDPRIIEGKRPLTCFDSEFAKQFIGKQGFVAGELTQFCDLNETDETTLKNVYQNETGCFVTSMTRYKYFLPAEWVIKNEPEWRPYIIDEWLQEHNFGDMIEFRHKSSKREFTVMFTGFVRETDGTMRIILGDWAENFDNLFEYYELIDKTNDGKFVWRPFGIEVKE